MKKRAFTIIELLVVMAIIAILIGIIMMTTGLLRNQARRTACAADLRSIGQSLIMYRDQNKHTWANALCQKPDLTLTYDQYNFLPMQIDLMNTDSTATGTQPSNATPSTIWQCPSDDSLLYPLIGSSYVYTDPQTLANKNELQNSPGTLATTKEFQGTYGYNDAAGKPAKIVVPVFHGGVLNVLYADGHVDNGTN